MSNFSSLEKIVGIYGFSKEELKKIKENFNNEYKIVDIPKPKGGYRTIFSPSIRLKSLLRILNEQFSTEASFPNGITAIQGRGLKYHLEPHIKKILVITTDIKDFFPSISIENLKLSLLKYTSLEEVLISEILEFSLVEDIIPQGFPTSSFFSNISILNLWERIQKLIKGMNIDISVYSDDWAISGDPDEVFLAFDILRKEVRREGFKLSNGKKKVMWKGKDQIVCNIKVNKGLEITDKYREEVRKEILVYREKFPLGDIEDPKLLGKIEFIRVINPNQVKGLE
ncbi:MAG: reverse transcriptase domain-containing protein [Candidatus Dojkabacteria bacterium]|jgi:hypothetical protein|nr:reverse transcriptase domain-containing protein [Candidatus Dojkabacteria bacterium]MDD4561206.1 reverse transcriptase domain-containing protein [Candidatus Dojkabacteria bacterium]MDY0097325.1 reverse transcriptase domain-containing protein [Candidatus Dojkabacteria bacterium]